MTGIKKWKRIITGKMAAIPLNGETRSILSLLLMKVTNLYPVNPL
jgi:hypothetical protein